MAVAGGNTEGSGSNLEVNTFHKLLVIQHHISPAASIIQGIDYRGTVPQCASDSKFEGTVNFEMCNGGL